MNLAASALFCLVLFSSCNRNQKAVDRLKNFKKVEFSIDGYPAHVVVPKTPLASHSWVWRSTFPTWHTEIDSILLSRGMYVAYVGVDDQFGNPTAQKVWDDFYKYVQDSLHLSKSVSMEVVSRGALYSYGWAKRHPETIECIYAEGPVCSARSWPGGQGKGDGDEKEWGKFLKAYNITEEQSAHFINPFDGLDPLAAHHIAMLHLVNDSDHVVPPSENSYIMAERYKKLGGEISIAKVTPGDYELHGHHYPVNDPVRYADFIFNHVRK
jgi:sialidase-1